MLTTTRTTPRAMAIRIPRRGLVPDAVGVLGPSSWAMAISAENVITRRNTVITNALYLSGVIMVERGYSPRVPQGKHEKVSDHFMSIPRFPERGLDVPRGLRCSGRSQGPDHGPEREDDPLHDSGPGPLSWCSCWSRARHRRRCSLMDGHEPVWGRHHRER